jgi:hypothetical protein
MMDMFPVRVVVESVRPQHCLTCSHDGQPILDTFAIVSGQTQLSQLVDTVLSALGLPQLIQDSRGFIQINNWKPLAFEAVTDNQDELVSNLFKEISSNVTLKILTKHSSTDPHSTQCITDLKHRLLKVAIDKQPQILTSVDNQEIKEILQQVIAGDDSSLLNVDQVQAVNDWLEQIAHEDNRKSPLSSSRFSPVSELPKLERWFHSDPNPSAQKLKSYMNILNGGAYRRSNNKVTYQQICNWFTNQRAAHRSSALSMSRPSSQSSSSAGSAVPVPTATITALPLGESTSHIPIANMPTDIRSKFNGSNGYNALLDRHDPERIDGGSESPTGNDDVSVHSGTSDAGMYEGDHKESNNSSPDLSLDTAPLSPRQLLQQHLQLQAQQSGGSLQMSDYSSNPAALAAAALSSLMPMSTLMGGNSPFSFSSALQHLSTPSTTSIASMCSPATSAITGATQTSSTSNGLRQSSNASSAHAESPIPGSTSGASANANSASNTARSRLMFDPLSELPILEKWFEENPHPGWMQIEQYTEMLNSLQYRQSYPPISTHNVKIWFKNRRAKCKRLLTNGDTKIGILSA